MTQKSPTTRSPLKRRPLRTPGEGLHDQFYGVAFDTVIPWFLVSAGLGVMAVTEWFDFYTKAPPNPFLYTLLFIVGTIVAAFQIRRGFKRADAIWLGFKGEKSVGHALEHFRREGYEVFHDVQQDPGNVDHVLIGPAGVFVVETKTISKPVSRNPTVTYDGERVLVDGHAPDRDPIAQVRACASGISSILERGTGVRPNVRPVVLYPGWWVDPQPKGVEVWVLNPDLLPAYIRHENAFYRDDQVKLFALALDTHMRSHEPAAR